MVTLSDTPDRSLVDLLAALRREPIDPSDPHAVLHELQVHQIELELQNRELREAQQALEESRDRYADLYDFAPVAYATLSRLGQITQMNLSAAQLLGVQRGQVPELFLTARLPPGDGLALLASLARVLTTQRAETLEVTLGRPPLQRRELRLMIQCENPHPRAASPSACRVILLDITQIKRAQASVLDQQYFLQCVVDGIVDPIVVTGLDHRVLLMNEAARESADVAKDAADRGGGEPDERCPAREVLASGAAVKVIQRRRGVAGQTRWVECIGAPLRGCAGDLLGVIVSSRDITEHVDLTEQLQARERQLQHLVKHDGLTGLPNRALFTDRLGQAMRQARRDQRQVAVLFLDLDRFKSINDSMGHAIGDRVLKFAAERMRALVRESDTVARLGGDEFAIVLGAVAHGADAGLVADKLVAAFRLPFAADGRSLAVTVSIGISLYPQDGDDADTLERNADAAMYRAKAHGRDTFCCYAEDVASDTLT